MKYLQFTQLRDSGRSYSVKAAVVNFWHQDIFPSSVYHHLHVLCRTLPEAKRILSHNSWYESNISIVSVYFYSPLCVTGTGITMFFHFRSSGTATIGLLTTEIIGFNQGKSPQDHLRKAQNNCMLCHAIPPHTQ